MRELILSSVVDVIVDNLANPFLQTLGKMSGFRDNVEQLQRTLPEIQALLEDAEEQQATDTAVKTWLSMFKDVAYEAEDLLLLVSDENYRWQAQYVGKVKEVVRALEKATDEGLRMNLSRRNTAQREWNRRETSSFVVESQVYGRDEEKKEIIELLLSSETTQDGEASCIRIVGMGGIGKTTLVQLAYNDPEVTKHFDVKVWVFVSDLFDVQRVMTTVIESVKKDKCQYSDLDALHTEASGLLRNKRYLIVLDDIWTEDQDDWDKLRPLFRGGIDGSKVLITTRSERVALATDSPIVPYYLNELSEDACWSLFKQRAFRRGEEELHTTLLLIGQQIVRKCGGVALAAKTLGSLMRFKRDIREWEFVRDSELWNLDEREDKILGPLRLSYSHLPPHLKRCLSFCSIFPRYYVFRKEKLIHLWMAEGFIESIPRSGWKEREDIGSDYFNDLLWMSFFQESKESENEFSSEYKMHDIIYDLVKSVAGTEYAIVKHGFATQKRFKNIRHSSILCDFRSPTIPEDLCEASHLRTLLLLSGGNLEVVPDELYSKIKYLIVLDLSGSGLMIDSSVGALSHLKYLDISHTPIRNLPPQIERLSFLETFNVFNCYNLSALPNLTRMRSLRHLNNNGCKALSYMLERSNLKPGYNSQLQTLPLFIIGDSADIQFLKKLNLRGSLKIKHIEKVKASFSVLKRMALESLGLYWGKKKDQHEFDSRGQPMIHFCTLERSKRIPLVDVKPRGLLDDFEPHPNLKELLIKRYPWDFVAWKVPYLKAVHLIDCKSRFLPTLGNLQLLTSLSLRKMQKVTSIGDEFYSNLNQQPFPALEELFLDGFPKLKKWFSPHKGGGAFPKLSKLILNDCPNLEVLPQFPSLKHLNFRNCNADVLCSFRNQTSLETLYIERVGGLRSFPGSFPSNNPHLTALEIKSIPQLDVLPVELGNLAALKTLIIRCCENLSSLPLSLQSLSALESLEIGDCHSLLYLPEVGTGGLSNIRSLSIENCNSLRDLSVGFQYVTSLEILTIMYCPRILALPSSIKHLSALRSLSILWCSALEKLPDELQNLMALNFLEVRSCPELKDLPAWIEKLVSLRSLAISGCHNIASLPEGMKRLTALQHLSIQDCPQLLLRCRQDIGEDWPKIEHVPHKHIESPALKRPREEGSSSLNY